AQRDLTLLPFVGPESRALAARSGITRWDDPRLSADSFGLGDSTEGRRLDAILMANRSTGDKDLLPSLLRSNIGQWQAPARFEIFVSVQGVEDQADDFSRVPERGGTAMLFMITWGFLDRDGHWQTRRLIARDLSPSAEAKMIEAWQTERVQWSDVRGIGLLDCGLFRRGPR